MKRSVLAVHGGAGALGPKQLAPDSRGALEAGLRTALEAGRDALDHGAGALDAAVAAVRCLEDDPLFNAGHGAVLCADGSAELSASLMCGRTRRTGAMAAVRRLHNPIAGAAALLDHVHGMLVGPAADAFGESAGCRVVDPDDFVTDPRRRQWKRLQARGDVSLDHDVKGTVGAVVLDARGDLAAATSTGGMANQLPGRIGDSPSIGAGTWADARCAVSATGHGEFFVRVAFARRVADLVELAGLSLEEATRRGIREVAELGGSGGCIAVDAEGRLALPFDTPHMLRGWVRGDGEIRLAIEPDAA